MPDDLPLPVGVPAEQHRFSPMGSSDPNGGTANRQSADSRTDDDEEKEWLEERQQQKEGPFRATWEKLRDVCYLIQDSPIFTFVTTVMIVLNAIVLAIVW